MKMEIEMMLLEPKNIKDCQKTSRSSGGAWTDSPSSLRRNQPH